MLRSIAKLMAAAIIAVPLYANVSSAAPISALTNVAPGNVEQARWGGGWRGGGWGGRGWGYFGGGFAAGAIIGGALAAPYYYGGGPYYYGGGPYYVDPGYDAAPYGGDDGTAYCMQRYRSYDPNSGTFLGNDGYRHPCP